MRARASAAAALLGVVVAAGGPAAYSHGAEPNDYPVTSLLSMLEGTATDATDPAVLGYTAGTTLGSVPRLLNNRPELTDPSAIDDPDVLLRLGQDLVDGATHTRPTAAGTNLVLTGNPYYLPDWNRNGVFGEAADYDIDNSPYPAVGRFRYPCVGMDAKVPYQTTDGRCVPGDTRASYRLGGVVKLGGIVNSRGLRLATKLWLPATALREGASKHPGVVFADGNLSRQADYYVYAQRLARAGYLVMSFDEAGQGDSEGGQADLYHAPAVAGCPVPGACRDLQDAVRWFVGSEVGKVVDLTDEPANAAGNPPRIASRHDPAYQPVGDNPRNPVLSLLDTRRVGITGQSMGSVATTSYLHHLAHPNAARVDQRRLPAIKAAVGISAFLDPSAAPVPVQVQTSDYDLPALQTVGPINILDGPVGTKRWYDGIRARREHASPMSMLVFEGGLHEAQSNVNLVPHSPWIAALSTSYQVDWFDCHLKSSAAACRRAVSARQHLSRATASEYDPDGGLGPAPSYCINVPDSAAVLDPGSLPALGGGTTHTCRVR